MIEQGLVYCDYCKKFMENFDQSVMPENMWCSEECYEQWLIKEQPDD